MKSKKQKKANLQKRVKSQYPGLIVSWLDHDPWTGHEIIEERVIKHRNPVNNIRARAIFKNFVNQYEKVRLYWRVTATIIFKYDNGMDQHESTPIDAFCMLSEISELCMDEIDAAMRYGNKDKFWRVKFEIECLSVCAPQKSVEQKLIEKLEAA